jgi:signal transduction histidine kinase
VQQRTEQISNINEQLERDIARRKIVESALRQRDQLLERRVKERTQQLSALLQVSAHVASTLELEPLLEIILRELQSVVSYSGGMILLWQEGELAVAARRGAVSAELQPWLRRPLHDIERELGWTGWRETVTSVDVRPILQRSGATPLLAREVRAWMAVPLMGRNALIGAVIVYHREPGHYTPRHNDLATAIARQAAVAIENAQLYEQGQNLAVLQERQRLARELHDSVSQALYGIALGARTASTLLAKDPQRAGEPLNYVLSLAEAGLAEMRALIFELRPETLENEGLVAALERQIAALRARHELDVVTDFVAEPAIALPAKEALYRVAQEATNNIVKHARASQVHIALQQEDGLLTLTVADDGRGFDAGRDFPGHLGLKTMRERVERLGGTLHIESRPGRGTQVQAELPLSVP